MTITTGMALNIAAGLSFSTESGANTAIVSGLGLELAAAGTATMTAPAVELAGFVTSNGTPVI